MEEKGHSIRVPRHFPGQWDKDVSAEVIQGAIRTLSG